MRAQIADEREIDSCFLRDLWLLGRKKKDDGGLPPDDGLPPSDGSTEPPATPAAE